MLEHKQLLTDCMDTVTNPERPTMLHNGEIIPVPDDVYQAWLDAGAPTAPIPSVFFDTDNTDE